MPNYFKEAAMGKEDTIAQLERMLERARRGEIDCIAMRLFRPDGTWEDVAAGGTAEAKAEALAKLREQH